MSASKQALAYKRHHILHPPTITLSPVPHPQGWRLDPLLLFGQLMTTGAAVSFAIEALRLRAEAYEGEVRTRGGCAPCLLSDAC